MCIPILTSSNSDHINKGWGRGQKTDEHFPTRDGRAHLLSSYPARQPDPANGWMHGLMWPWLSDTPSVSVQTFQERSLGLLWPDILPNLNFCFPQPRKSCQVDHSHRDATGHQWSQQMRSNVPVTTTNSTIFL